MVRFTMPLFNEHPSLLQIPYDTPDSPLTATESVDDWALSSLAEATSDDDSAAPRFIMPRNNQIATFHNQEVGKLRALVLGGPRSGKSELIQALYKIEPLKDPHKVYLAPGITAVNFQVFTAEHTVSFVDGGSQEYLEAKMQETAALINGAHPGAISVISQARNLDQIPLFDCVIYCFSGAPTQSDIAALQNVAPFVPIIPIVTMCDCLSSVELFERRVDVKRKLGDNHLPVHYFDGQSLPYITSTLTTHNWDMTASQVESTGYQSHVLIESQLTTLVEQMLSASKTLRERAAYLFTEMVTRNAMRNAFNPFPQPRYYHLNLRNAMISGPNRDESQPRARKMAPIGNIDPLDVGKWAQTIGFFAAVALTLAGAGVALSPGDSSLPVLPMISLWQTISPVMLCPF